MSKFDDMNHMSRDFNTVILASGLSERMGEPKALLRYDQSATFLEKIIREYLLAGSDSVICMINSAIESFCNNMEVPLNVRFVVNNHPEWGRFFSIRKGLEETRDSNYCFIQNVDNPSVTCRLIENLLEKRDPDAWCSPVYRGKGGHPVLLPVKIINEIIRIDDPEVVLSDMLKHYTRIMVETEDETVLRNINSPEDYTNYISRR